MSSPPETQRIPGNLSLEDIVIKANQVGLEYAFLKKEAEFLELMRPVTRAKITLAIESEQPELSETKLRRLTEAHDEYISFIKNLSEAKMAAEKARIRYESYKNLFEAKRSQLSYKKAEMNLL